LSGNVSHDTAEILSRIWVVGVLPLFVGLALIFNGVVVSKKLVELSRREPRSTEPNIKGRDAEPHALRAADTSEFIPAGFSVTEGTTQHLGSPLPKQQAPDNN
ncbi:MAG TPA: hypothetical protein VNA19_12125, partial [Pyrinomonadaceae bacterium]|nr:hypothetical protein [Pyrinomonadaceae bacterium]